MAASRVLKQEALGVNISVRFQFEEGTKAAVFLLQLCYHIELAENRRKEMFKKGKPVE